ncbi:hypothetical protein B9Z47_09525 [Limnohabitans sp. 2KL-1]|uniref:hypothetical protein n=1 Tax=Limnohabitans sp. 2KL-1 TaxID=1100699 RepID=UPI000D38DEA8|nr:hypothetical protein [Limnohabitans sp. 2KL-1]PUE48064.1 hypothetical protein B9Z47_09525 [Limnohabitans sp. 2KL-1]
MATRKKAAVAEAVAVAVAGTPRKSRSPRKAAAVVANTPPPIVESKAEQPKLATKRRRAPKSAPGLVQGSLPTPGVDQALERKLAKQPPRALASPIRVFQMYVEPWQRELLDASFYPLDVSRVAPKELGLTVWTQLQTNDATQGALLWGAVSWRFAEQTGMAGADWVRLIEQQPGADVYFSCADTAQEAVFHNPWLQTQVQLPRLQVLAQAFFEAAGLPVALLGSITPSSLYCTAPMVVGTPQFWAAYLPWLRKVLTTADKRMPAALRDELHAPLPVGSAESAASYVQLMVQMLLPVFLRSQGQDFKALRLALPERERELNVHQKLLREMKDVAHRTQSAWLAACWVNYRNLYLGQTQSKPWVQKHLRSITPSEIKFA